ncbi:hypothetical protein, partial [Pseudomonas savastanoi]|uniref:hypothetical protein n=1 Tax=Pseudomonas savastanoi TaxID=29438 RepID=UPI00196A08B5
TDLPDRAGKTRACLTAGPNQPEHKKTDTPLYVAQGRWIDKTASILVFLITKKNAGNTLTLSTPRRRSPPLPRHASTTLMRQRCAWKDSSRSFGGYKQISESGQ